MRRMRTALWVPALLLIILGCLTPSVARADDAVSAQSGAVEFVYLDYTAVAPGDEQNIVVAFSDLTSRLPSLLTGRPCIASPSTIPHSISSCPFPTGLSKITGARGGRSSSRVMTLASSG